MASRKFGSTVLKVGRYETGTHSALMTLSWIWGGLPGMRSEGKEKDGRGGERKEREGHREGKRRKRKGNHTGISRLADQ